MVQGAVQGNRPDVPDPDRIEGTAEVVCACDDVNGTASLIVADLTCDDAWLSIGVADAVELDAWR